MQPKLEYFDPEFKGIPGYIVVPFEGQFRHSFGGNSWQTCDANPFKDGPALLFTFDLTDPQLQRLQIGSLTELPLCSYINSTVMNELQEYEILPEKRTILLVKKLVGPKVAHNGEAALPNPLPQRSISLRPMSEDEYPYDESSYLNCVDNLSGGDAFIRVLNVPIWDDNKVQPLTVYCSNCATTMMHVVTMGSENANGRFYLPNECLYFGDFFLYFFLCQGCLRLKVISSLELAAFNQ